MSNPFDDFQTHAEIEMECSDDYEETQRATGEVLTPSGPFGFLGALGLTATAATLAPITTTVVGGGYVGYKVYNLIQASFMNILIS